MTRSWSRSTVVGSPDASWTWEVSRYFPAPRERRRDDSRGLLALADGRGELGETRTSLLAISAITLVPVCMAPSRSASRRTTLSAGGHRGNA
jgi:hypothetical protein